MLTKITLHDFQKHKKLELPLGKITTLVGPSDAGKTAIIRAIMWLSLNYGRTSNLVRRGAKEATVSLEVDDHIIERSTKGNSYSIDGQLYKAIGRGVPDDVSNILRMGEDNFQTQHEYLFWFTATGSALVSNLNKIVDLTPLENYVKTGTKLGKQELDKFRYFEKRESELADEIARYLPFESIDKEYSVLETDIRSLVAENERFKGIDSTISQIRTVSSRLLLVGDFSDYVEEIVTKQEEWQELNRRHAVISNCLVSISTSSMRISRITDLVNNAPDYEEVKSIFDKIEWLERWFSAYNRTMDDKKLGDFIEELDALLITYEKLYDDASLMRELRYSVSQLSKPIPDDPSELIALADEATEILSRGIGIRQIVHSIDVIRVEITSKNKEIDDIVGEINSKSEGICPTCGKVLEGGICDI